MGEAPQGGAPAGAVVGRAAAVDLFVDGADGATTMTMAMGDDNDDDGDSPMGNEVDNDGDGATGDDNDHDDDGIDDDDGDGDIAMGSGATGYDDNNNGKRRQ